MKKIIKNNMFGFILGILLCGGIVYAASYYAKDVTYIPTDASWEVNNVNDAINSLYDSQKNSTKKAMVFTSSPVDMKQYTDRWAELTVNDFICGASSVGSSVANNSSAGCSSNLSESPMPTYDSTTGKLTFTASFSKSQTVGAGGMLKSTLSGKSFCVWLGTIGGQ